MFSQSPAADRSGQAYVLIFFVLGDVFPLSSSFHGERSPSGLSTPWVCVGDECLNPSPGL